VHSSSQGQGKQAEFQGYRQEVLNSLVNAYWSVTELDYSTRQNNDLRRAELVNEKRVFVSEIQSILKPAREDEEVAKITGTSFNTLSKVEARDCT
jgi:hypothetical protein